MAPVSDIRPSVEKHSRIPVGCFRVLNSFDEVRLSEIRQGVIFVYASWSGAALLAFGRFTQVMQSCLTPTLDLVVLNTECLTEESAVQLFGNDGFCAGGYGEVIWVRNGQVIAREIAGEESESLIRKHTSELLNELPD